MSSVWTSTQLAQLHLPLKHAFLFALLLERVPQRNCWGLILPGRITTQQSNYLEWTRTRIESAGRPRCRCHQMETWCYFRLWAPFCWPYELCRCTNRKDGTTFGVPSYFLQLIELWGMKISFRILWMDKEMKLFRIWACLSCWWILLAGPWTGAAKFVKKMQHVIACHDVLGNSWFPGPASRSFVLAWPMISRQSHQLFTLL